MAPGAAHGRLGPSNRWHCWQAGGKGGRGQQGHWHRDGTGQGDKIGPKIIFGLFQVKLVGKGEEQSQLYDQGCLFERWRWSGHNSRLQTQDKVSL